MGNKKSLPKPKEKTPFDILEISPESTKEEIRKAYLSMLLKYHPTRNKESSDEKVIEIKDAYEALISGTYKPNLKLDLSLYNHDYFSKLKDNFYDSVDNFIKKLLVEEPEATYPSFKSINHKKFYDYFSKFKTQRKFCDDKFLNKEMQNEFNLKVREIIEIIKKYDSRLIKEIKKIEIKIKTKKTKNKKERVTEFNCKDCCKGFKNVNQFINHLQSKKHCEKANWSEERRELEINKIKEREVKESKEEIEESEDELELKIKRNEKLLEELYTERNKRKEMFEEEVKEKVNKEEKEKLNEEEKVKEEEKISEKVKNKKVPKKRKKKEKTKEEPLTKCTICNSKFDSRNKLFLHLKETHTPTKHKKKYKLFNYF